MTPLAETKASKVEYPESLSWKENPSVKNLLDVIVSILKEQYIQTAKENPEILSK